MFWIYFCNHFRVSKKLPETFYEPIVFLRRSPSVQNPSAHLQPLVCIPWECGAAWSLEARRLQWLGA